MAAGGTSTSPYYLFALTKIPLQVAAGNPLPLEQTAIPLVGHAFEARIYAENPRNNFLPDSGQLLYLSTPEPTHVFAPPLDAHRLESSSESEFTPVVNTSAALAPLLRLEQGFEQGAQIGVFYDPMIAKLVVHGRDRTEALRKLRTALEEYRVVGVSTNIEFLRTLAGNQAFIAGEVETGFIPVCQYVSTSVSTLAHRDVLRTTSMSCSHPFLNPLMRPSRRRPCSSCSVITQHQRRLPHGAH